MPGRPRTVDRSRLGPQPRRERAKTSPTGVINRAIEHEPVRRGSCSVPPAPGTAEAAAQLNRPAFDATAKMLEATHAGLRSASLTPSGSARIAGWLRHSDLVGERSTDFVAGRAAGRYTVFLDRGARNRCLRLPI